jgi:hypothetical protein
MRLTYLTGRHRSTIWKVLARHGRSRRRRSSTRQTTRRYECSEAGALLISAEQPVIRHRSRRSRRHVQAVPRATRLRGHAICLLGEDEFGEVRLRVVELDLCAPLPRGPRPHRSFSRCWHSRDRIARFRWLRPAASACSWPSAHTRRSFGRVRARGHGARRACGRAGRRRYARARSPRPRTAIRAR